MTTETSKNTEIIEGNELIAEFMGVETREETATLHKRFLINERFYAAQNLKYHLDWNWLMPVVEKIESIKFNGQTRFPVAIEDKICAIADISYPSDVDEYIVNIQVGKKIEAAWTAIVEFVKWYKTQTK